MINVFVSGSPTTQMLIMYVWINLLYLISSERRKRSQATKIQCAFVCTYSMLVMLVSKQLFASWSRKIMNFRGIPQLVLLLFLYTDLAMQMEKRIISLPSLKGKTQQLETKTQYQRSSSEEYKCRQSNYLYQKFPVANKIPEASKQTVYSSAAFIKHEGINSVSL